MKLEFQTQIQIEHKGQQLQCAEEIWASYFMGAVSFFMYTQFIFMHATVRTPRWNKTITDNM